MECHSLETHPSVLCSNGYYGYQPVLNGSAEAVAHSNGHVACWNPASAAACTWRKRSRDCFGNGDTEEGRVEGELLALKTAKRLCPEFHYSELQQAMETMDHSMATEPPHATHEGERVTVGEEGSAMEYSRMGEAYPMAVGGGGVEGATCNGHLNESASGNDSVGGHTCRRMQLCTMSLDQPYTLPSSQDCPRCLAGEPGPYYLTVEQTVENLSRLW